MSVDLPEGHGIAEAGEHMITAGMKMKVAGVRFTCPMGDMDCTVIVAEGGASATYSGGEPTVALLDAAGYQAFMNLSDALLDTEAADGTIAVSDDLRGNLYHDDLDVMDNDGTADVDESVDNGGGVTTSLTTHEEPGANGADDPLTGVSDIFVGVTPTLVIPASELNDTKRLMQLDDTEDPETHWVISYPVRVDADGNVTSNRTANFDAEADWARNPAAEWTSPTLIGAADNMEDLATDDLNNLPETGGDIWSHYFQSTKTLDGGRTLDLDLRSDYNPRFETLLAAMGIAQGPPSTGDDDQVRVRWDMIDMDGGDVTMDGERNLPVDDPETTVVEGIPGSYMGVKGVFYCAEGQNAADETNICRINHHQSGMMGVSEDDTVMFSPYAFTLDTDWLAAGVWLTIPDDEEDGDYAIGAFVFGNNPYKAASESNAQAILGTATYQGEAFGRYAEDDADDKETGRFTADAMLMADFGDGTAMGTIHGDLTGFMANGQSEDWDVNFEQAMIEMGMDDQDTPEVVDNSALRFNAGASGHARGHGLTGFWNGQFYGGSADGTPRTPLPGSAAGTFGLTSERDADDDYSLILGGAFATHRQDEE